MMRVDEICAYVQGILLKAIFFLYLVWQASWPRPFTVCLAVALIFLSQLRHLALQD